MIYIIISLICSEHVVVNWRTTFSGSLVYSINKKENQGEEEENEFLYWKFSKKESVVGMMIIFILRILIFIIVLGSSSTIGKLILIRLEFCIHSWFLVISRMVLSRILKHNLWYLHGNGINFCERRV